ncbi:HD-GYP domain-containing protein [Clostridium sp. PL3]|uniref:HD-GYP domain-containing protein n=1 Tax=Clostridium thailandense TaxID=2794346 RepID=A0A949WTL8_9CLOT|nr:HD-GYP domain-containing protein [Clostridium thailandense]MBV7276351.1 HD-GYP domain-containing protein [Clostridium thailandense]
MTKKKIFLTLSELKPDMVVAEELRADGILLLNEGTKLTGIIIDKLKEVYFYGKVAIYSDGADTLKFYQNKSVEEIEEIFIKLSVDIKGIFNNVEENITTNTQEVTTFAQKIREELNSTKSIIKNVILSGSGEDVIYRHSVNVTALSSVLGKWLGFSENEINLLNHAAILHDFGKTKVDSKILNKILPLKSEDWIEIKKHPVYIYNSLKGITSIDPSIIYGVLMHHERLDGSGYPLGVKADKIHPFAKIIAIADTFDAINSDRIYRKSLGPFEALATLKRESLGKLDYEYCKVFIEHVLTFLMGESVLLNTNKICTVIGINSDEISRPLLFDGSEFLDLKNHKEIYITKLLL